MTSKAIAVNNTRETGFTLNKKEKVRDFHFPYNGMELK